MLDRISKHLWINHPRSARADTMLTLAFLSTLAAIAKFFLNDVSLTFGSMAVNFGRVDGGLIAALLTPTLGAYCARKWKDSPDGNKN